MFFGILSSRFLVPFFLFILGSLYYALCAFSSRIQFISTLNGFWFTRSHLPREIMLRIKSTIYFTGQVLRSIPLVRHSVHFAHRMVTRFRKLPHKPLEPQPFLHRLCQVLHTLAGLSQSLSIPASLSPSQTLPDLQDSGRSLSSRIQFGSTFRLSYLLPTTYSLLFFNKSLSLPCLPRREE